jgi:hypothetical protein
MSNPSQVNARQPKDGYVPNKETAIKVAEAVLIPIYGAAQVQAEEPFSAKLAAGQWIITGNLPAGADGGVAEVRISKATGQILSVRHGK